VSCGPLVLPPAVAVYFLSGPNAEEFVACPGLLVLVVVVPAAPGPRAVFCESDDDGFTLLVRASAIYAVFCATCSDWRLLRSEGLDTGSAPSFLWFGFSAMLSSFF